MIDWHYPRTELAARYLQNLFEHGMTRLAFFGRRRIGKTEFLQRDLIPEAGQRGIAAIYCSFWENKDQPQLAFIRALQNALPATAWKPKFKLGLSSGIDLSAEIERAERPRAPLASELSQAAALFSDWTRQLKQKPALIVLDEIQHLATSSQFASFAASLRTLLDMAPATVRVVFTGSSMVDLQRLFQDQKAPFFNFSVVQDFPPLDRAFIAHLQTLHQRLTRKTCNADELWQLFERVGCNAQILTGLAQQMVLQDTADWRALWAVIEEELIGKEGWCEKLWGELPLSDRIVYLLLRQGQDLFSEASLAVYAQAGFSRGTAQQALRRLVNRGLLYKSGHGAYQRIMPLLDEWLTQQGLRPDSLLAQP